VEINKHNYEWMADQVALMSVLPGYGQIKPQGIDALVNFMLGICESEECATRVIAKAIAEEEKMPPPVFLKEILERLGYWPANRPPIPGMKGYVPPKED